MSTEPARPVAAAKLMRAHLAGDEAAVLALLADVHPIELIAGLLSIATSAGCRAFGDADSLDVELQDGLDVWAAPGASSYGGQEPRSPDL